VGREDFITQLFRIEDLQNKTKENKINNNKKNKKYKIS
jgi:hypothetical protein